MFPGCKSGTASCAMAEGAATRIRASVVTTLAASTAGNLAFVTSTDVRRPPTCRATGSRQKRNPARPGEVISVIAERLHGDDCQNVEHAEHVVQDRPVRRRQVGSRAVAAHLLERGRVAQVAGQRLRMVADAVVAAVLPRHGDCDHFALRAAQPRPGRTAGPCTGRSRATAPAAAGCGPSGCPTPGPARRATGRTGWQYRLASCSSCSWIQLMLAPLLTTGRANNYRPFPPPRVMRATAACGAAVMSTRLARSFSKRGIAWRGLAAAGVSCCRGRRRVAAGRTDSTQAKQ